MINRRRRVVGLVVGVCAAMLALQGSLEMPVAHAQTKERVFELRTYTAHPGKFEAMKARFKDHIVKLFEKHGMELVGFWTAADSPNAENTLIYVLAHQSREAAKKSWDGFRADPAWAKLRADTEKEGPINLKVESVFMNPVEYSPIK